MPWTSTGFVRDNSAFTGSTVWADDAAAGTKITTDHHDYHDQDIANGITTCLRKDGGNSPSTSINWNGQKITNYGVSAVPSAASDVGRYGTDVTAVGINASTKVLTLTRADGDLTVDLTPIVVAGDTSDFARLSLDQEFAGANTFDQSVLLNGGFTINKTGGNVDAWTQTADAYKFDLNYTGTYSGTALEVIPSGTNAGKVYAFGSLLATTGDLANYAVKNSAQTISGIWTFSASVVFANFQQFANGSTWVSATAGQSWYQQQLTGTFMEWAGSGGNSVFAFYGDDGSSGNGSFQVNGYKVWDQAKMRVLTAAPTGGNADDIAFVTTGVDKGVWANVSGTWTKIAS